MPVATTCLEDEGGADSAGFLAGYNDGQRDFAGLNGHGFDSSVHHGSNEFKTGYKNGYNQGFEDARYGIHLGDCPYE